MGNEWTPISFSKAVNVNPAVKLTKGTEYPFVDMKSVDPTLREVSFIELRPFKNGGAKFLPEDTLMARITPCLENGKIARYMPAQKNGEAFGSTEFIVIRGKDGVTDNDFAYYLTIWLEFRKFAISQMTGSSGRQRVPADSLAGFEFNLPPLAEQKAIARILGSLDDKIEVNRRMNGTLEAMAQAVFQSWFVDFDPVIDNALGAGDAIPGELMERAKRRQALGDGRQPLPEGIRKLFPAQFEYTEGMGWIPKGWRVKSLDMIADYINGLACQKYRPKENEKGLPVIKIRELSQGITNSCDITSENVVDPKYIIQNGDILFSWSGTLMTKIWCGGIGILNQHIFKVSSNFYPKWFYYHWTDYYVYEFQRIAFDKATTMGHIKRHHLSDAKVLIPSNKLFEYMSKEMNHLLDKKISLLKQIQTLSKIRDTLLPKLLSGEIRIPEAEHLAEHWDGNGGDHE